jgi:phosphotriesterase-related protein
MGKTIYVDDDATGANDGTSWTNAYVYLQDALADGETAEEPVEIRVAQGIYRPDQGTGITHSDREATFQLINDVTVLGGYIGVGEPDPNSRNVELYESILSGDLNGDDTQVASPRYLLEDPSRSENSYHVVNSIGTNDTAMLDGFTITGGVANGTPRKNAGGGLFNDFGSPTLVNCTFQENWAFNGGGMFNESGNLTLSKCVFKENYSDNYGGGIFNHRGNPLFRNCRFTGNFARVFGGGISYWTSSPEFTSCIFSGNIALLGGGGGVLSQDSKSILNNCTFSGNSAWLDGAVHEMMNNELILTNCILWDNIPKNNDHLPLEITVSYSNVPKGWLWGDRNINTNPLFVNPGYWADANDPNIVVEPNDPNAVWVDGDYHLKSQYGRWNPVSESWVMDEVTSPCIDAGDLNSPVGDEPEPNGDRVNMGAYGGTAEASKSDYTWWFATTDGPVAAEGLGIILPHEHIFTDLRGPTSRTYGQADAADVVRVMGPLLEEARQKGVGLLIECSSIGVGRNVSIIAQVAEASGLPVVVPTGVYGRANFAPPEHRNMSEDELTVLFINEIREGIDGTDIKAGFIKIATGNGPLTALEEKFLRAAGRAASETGAAVASHTPTGSKASGQADILESISPAIRLIWVHAQNESNRSLHRQLAARGVFIEFDSLGWNPGQDSRLITAIKELLAAGYGDRILLSHDAGWYQPGEQNGGTQMPYTYLIETFIPKLRNSGVNDKAIRMITETNPIRAFGFKSNE